MKWIIHFYYLGFNPTLHGICFVHFFGDSFFLQECELFSPPWLSLLVFFTLFLKHSKSLSIWFNIVHLTAATKALKELPLCPEHIKSCRMICRNNIFVFFRLFFIFCHWATSTKSLFSWKYEKSLIINILFFKISWKLKKQLRISERVGEMNINQPLKKPLWNRVEMCSLK